MAQYLLGAPSSDGESLLVFTYIWLKDVEKISKVPSALRNVTLTWAITWLVGVTIYCIIFKWQYSSTPLQFFSGKTVLKKNS